MKIYIASDHAGYNLKKMLMAFLEKRGDEVTDCGPYEYNEDDDYPDYVAAAASQVSENPDDCLGIVIGGTGQGEAIMANRFPNVRAVVFDGQFPPPDKRDLPNQIIMTREHNNANVLSLGAWFMDDEEAKRAVALWLETPFSGEERHIRRLNKIENLASQVSSKNVS